MTAIGSFVFYRDWLTWSAWLIIRLTGQLCWVVNSYWRVGKTDSRRNYTIFSLIIDTNCSTHTSPPECVPFLDLLTDWLFNWLNPSFSVAKWFSSNYWLTEALVFCDQIVLFLLVTDWKPRFPWTNGCLLIIDWLKPSFSIFKWLSSNYWLIEALCFCDQIALF